jgi:hypothetical protein
MQERKVLSECGSDDRKKTAEKICNAGGRNQGDATIWKIAA